MDASSQDLSKESAVIPAGLEFLYSLCRKLYPTQPNPLQVTSVVKYWLGGPDPLDYISMFEHPGDEDEEIPPHWHYISFGCSDLHGDGRVHKVTSPEEPSGFGFEFTFRLKKEPGEISPPTWPAALLQALARYVFETECTLCIGDHVCWCRPLDNSNSHVRHMLMTKDTQLNKVMTPNGSVQFFQVVGITGEELLAAQHWKGTSVLEIMRRYTRSGGVWLVNDMKRECIYDIDPTIEVEIENGIENDGSDLSGVTARLLKWSPNFDMPPESMEGAAGPVSNMDEGTSQISKDDSDKIKSTLERGLNMNTPGPNPGNQHGNLQQQAYVLPSLHIFLNLQSAAILPLALRGRLKHGRHFTFKCIDNKVCLTIVPPGVPGAFVTEENPYAINAIWLQALIPNDFLDVMSEDLSSLCNPDEVTTPLYFKWPERKLSITVLGDEDPVLMSQP